MLALFKHILVLVIGGGDLASGVIYRLHKVGFSVAVTELEAPLFVRRAVSYGEAIYQGQVTVDGITAQHAKTPEQILPILKQNQIPVIADPQGDMIRQLKPSVIVDARMHKSNLGIAQQDAPLVIGLGPGFHAGQDVHAVIETMRGHTLGRVIWDGSPAPDTGEPGSVKGITHTRVLRAPAAGHVQPQYAIGEHIAQGAVIGHVNDKPIVAAFDGVLRGIVHPNVWVHEGMKIGDLDPRGNREACFTISDKSLAIGGGVLEAIFSFPILQQAILSGCHETI